YLEVKTLAVLALGSRSLYAAVQTPLYRHPRIPSFSALSLFVRTLNQVSECSAKGKRWLWWRHERPLSKDVVDLHVTINSTDNVSQTGQRPLAIIISRLITAISIHCPAVDITLCFVRSHHHHAPIIDLEKEIFPRVTKLVLYLGRNSPGIRSPYSWPSSHQTGVFPSLSSFWRPYLNGYSFPDCRSFELNQYWDDVPIGVQPRLPPSTPITGYESPPTPSGIDAALAALGPLKGLKKLESISLAWPTELNSTTLAAIFSPRATSVAANLKKLELRYCNVSYSVMAALMRQCLPVLTHFTLLYAMDSPSNGTGRQRRQQHGCHLCPLVREYAKDLTSLKLAAPSIYRELFIDEQEQKLLHTVGIDTAVGCLDGRIAPGKALDRYAISQTLSHHRMNKSSERQYASKGRRERIVVSWQGLCGHDESWQELCTEADMEEPGIAWTLM
ncbi:MAG: hypothetical protein M1835_002174, partial [Candelina submexicana]